MSNKHLDLFDSDVNWLLALTEIVNDKSLLQFVIELDQTYLGLEAYLGLEEMPGPMIAKEFAKNNDAHKKFQCRVIVKTFDEMPFFKLSAVAKLESIECVWNPTEETLKEFSLKHTDKEIIYFEDEAYKATIQFFKKRFSNRFVVQ